MMCSHFQIGALVVLNCMSLLQSCQAIKAMFMSKRWIRTKLLDRLACAVNIGAIGIVSSRDRRIKCDVPKSKNGIAGDPPASLRQKYALSWFVLSELVCYPAPDANRWLEMDWEVFEANQQRQATVQLGMEYRSCCNPTRSRDDGSDYREKCEFEKHADKEM